MNSLAARAMEIAMEKGLALVPASCIRKAEAEQRRTLRGEGSGSKSGALRWTGYGGAAFAAAAVAVAFQQLPAKLNPIIQPLMAATRRERDEEKHDPICEETETGSGSDEDALNL